MACYLYSSRACALVSFSLDNFRHGHAELVLDENDFAPSDLTVVDVNVDRLADLAVEFEHGAGAELEQFADFKKTKKPCTGFLPA
jgi:hypothetical protein